MADGQTVNGAPVNGGVGASSGKTDAIGQGLIIFSYTGPHEVKATKLDVIRSNQFTIQVN